MPGWHLNCFCFDTKRESKHSQQTNLLNRLVSQPIMVCPVSEVQVIDQSSTTAPFISEFCQPTPHFSPLCHTHTHDLTIGFNGATNKQIYRSSKSVGLATPVEASNLTQVCIFIPYLLSLSQQNNAPSPTPLFVSQGIEHPPPSLHSASKYVSDGHLVSKVSHALQHGNHAAGLIESSIHKKVCFKQSQCISCEPS